jgi:large subunit ribosomal protein L9e
MKYLKFTRKIAVPEGVKVEIKSRVVTVTGERGTLQKDFRHIQIDLKLQSKGRKVVAELWHCDRKTAACLRSITAAIQNMITGVTKGFRYKMRLVYAHFPINVNIEEDGTLLEIRNFLGEKIVRAVKLGEGVTIERSSDVKDELVLSGNDINNVSQSAARIQQSCLVKNKDIRKYLDGIYVSEKGHVVQED